MNSLDELRLTVTGMQSKSKLIKEKRTISDNVLALTTMEMVYTDIKNMILQQIKDNNEETNEKNENEKNKNKNEKNENEKNEYNALLTKLNNKYEPIIAKSAQDIQEMKEMFAEHCAAAQQQYDEQRAKLEEEHAKQKAENEAIRAEMAAARNAQFDESMQKISEIYDEEVEIAVKGLTSMIQPLLVVFIGAIVGTVVIALYLPIFNMASVVGG